MTLFGPGLTAWFVAYSAGLVDKEVPWPILVVMAFVALLAWGVLLRSFLFRPRFEASRSRGTLDLYRRPRGEPLLRLHADDVASLGLESKVYRPEEGKSVVNAVVTLHTRAGETLALCASPDTQRMRELRGELAAVLRAETTPPEEPTNRLDRARLAGARENGAVRS